MKKLTKHEVDELRQLCRAGQFAEALGRGAKLLTTHAATTGVHDVIGYAQLMLGKTDDAIVSFNAALSLDPNNQDALNNLGIIYGNLGRTADAVSSYEKALGCNPLNATAHRNLSTQKKYQVGDAQISQLEALLGNLNVSQSDRMHASLALGKIYGDLGKFQESFDMITEGNLIHKKAIGYDLSHDKAFFAGIKKLFGLSIPPYGPLPKRDTSPVLIVGMPRTGSTLVEQILTSHSEVSSIGETMLLRNMIDRIQWRLDEFSRFQLNDMWSTYCQTIANMGLRNTVVVDKALNNFLLLGFVLAADPAVKVVHVQRDRVATCWGNFTTFFTNGGFGFSCTLEDTAAYYLMYQDLMAFWHEKFPNRIYDLSYEALTENQEAETRKLLDYVGLSWLEQCLEFHKNGREVSTASAAQVRQKMFTGSSQAWRRYETQLQPLMKALDIHR